MYDTGSTAYAWNPNTKVASATATAIAATKEMRPDGTWGGISTKPNTAISGVDDKYFEATSPVIVHSDSSAWTGTTTWKSACTEALSYLITRLTRGNGMDERPDLCILNQSDFLDLKSTIKSDVSQQVILTDTPTEPDAGMYPRVHIKYEGVTVCYDLDCPANVQFMLNTDHLYFDTLGQSPDNFLGKKGPVGGAIRDIFKVDMDKSIDQGAWKIAASLCGQLYANPYYQGMGYTGF
jgi:hypothetical protein